MAIENEEAIKAYEKENCRRMLLDTFGSLYKRFNEDLEIGPRVEPARLKLIVESMAMIYKTFF